MSDVVIGAVVGLVASLVTTVVIRLMEWRRENQVRWDKDILTVATEALISTERAKGKIYAWSRGARGDDVHDSIDAAYYRMKSLEILFPHCKADIKSLQDDIVALADLTGRFTSGEVTASEYETESSALRARVDRSSDRLLSSVQDRLSMDRPGKS